ncbi:MAG: hypothetical protein HQ567_26405 [Candidatus Nealsonbacteria bacterium]|nr:hypothetical protein [Candidatus Nealsonbacteria bacterium]
MRTLFVIVTVVAVFCGLAAWYQLPHSPEDFVQRGMVRFRAGHYEDAISDLTEALHRAESDERAGRSTLMYAAYAIRAAAYHKVGKYEKSARDASRAIHLKGPLKGPPDLWLPMSTDVGEYFVLAHTRFQVDLDMASGWW